MISGVVRLVALNYLRKGKVINMLGVTQLFNNVKFISSPQIHTHIQSYAIMPKSNMQIYLQYVTNLKKNGAAIPSSVGASLQMSSSRSD